MNIISATRAAELLRMDKAELLKMLNNGEVPAVRIGRNWRIEEEQLTEWFKAKAEAERKERQNEMLG